MSEEEKEAIERLNKRYKFMSENPLATNVFTTLDVHNLGIVLNLIDKLQKENEELKEELFVERKTHISKYAIRNKIKEIEEDADFQAIEVLYELLEEKTNEQRRI